MGSELRTTFPVSPSKDYTIVDLLLGKVGIEIIKPDSSETGVMVGVDGGRLVDADGNILNIAQGALAQTTPVSTKTAAAATGAVGSDFTLIRAVEVNLTRQTLAIPATISIPAPPGLDASLPLVVAKQIDVKGVAKLKLIALARQSGTLISSEPLTQPLTNSTTQLNSSGVYYFLQAKAPIGFVTGTVSDSGSAPFTGALVKTDSGSLVDLASSNGRYLLAAPVATFIATALDLYKNDEVSANSAITAANQIVNLDLKIEKIPPAVVSVSPANGAVKVQPDVPVVVTFSKAMDKTTITSSTLVVRDAANSEIAGALTFSIDSKTVTFYPAEAFKQETGYSVTIAASVKDLQGYLLGQDVTSTFTIRRTTPPVMPAAGSISGTFPDTDGFITITATQGSANPNDTVLLINDTTGEITSVTPQSNGSFTGKVRGQLGDEIKVVLMDYSGNQTTVSYITFKNTDGSYLVTAKGGKVEGEGGSILDIPEGALVGPAIIKVTAVQEANLPSPLQAPGQYLAAFNIDSGGIPFKSEVKLSIPLPTGFDPATPVFVTRPAEVFNDDGTVEKVYEIIDSTKVENGRITTASPPFDGVMGFGSFAFTAFPEVNVGIVSGYAYQEMNGEPGYQPTANGSIEIPTKDAAGNLVYKFDKPVPRAVVRTPAAWNYVSYANSKGFYSGMTTLYGNVGATDLEYKVTAIHPFTMQRQTITGYLTLDSSQVRNIISNLNFKLAEKNTIPPDTAAPTISISLAVAPSQAATSRIIAGTVKTGTPLSLSIVVTDQQLEWATLSTTFTAPGAAPVQISSSLTQSGSGQLFAPDGKILTRYLYSPVFDGTSTYFTPTQEGTYNFTITAKDATGNQSNRSISIRAVPDGTSLGSGIEGAPTIDAVIPAAESKEIMVTAPVMVWFSEPVDNVNDSTFILIDSLTGIKVPATVTSGLEAGRMQATLTPKGNLYYARKYEIRLTSAITDSYDNADGSRMNLAPYSSFFATKVPKGYDLSTDQQFTGGRDIALYTFDAEDGESTTYAYVMAGDKGWRIVDVTDPTAPEVIHYATSSCSAYTQSNCRITASQFDMRSVAINPDTKIMSITENITFADGNQYGYVRFYDLSELPGFPPIVGRERLAEAYSGIPGRVAMYGNNAYVATTNVGVQVVGVEEAKAANSGSSDGSSIVGVYDSIGEGYGQPSDIITYGAAKALLTTTSGYLLMLDINYPLPQFMSKYQSTPHRFFRAGVAAEYPYLDQFGNQQMDDIAVVGTMDGKVLTLNLTDPYDQKYIATAKNKDGQELKTTVREISVSKESGLAFVTTVNSVQVIDFKDPGNPRLLTEIISLPDSSGALDASGNPIMLPIGAIPAIVERGGWVYLASQGQGLKVVDLDPHHLKTFPNPIILADSVNGIALADVNIRYEIYPDKAFVPVVAFVVVYEEGQEIWKENVLLEGKGTTTFKATENGRIFNINKKYESAIRLRDAIGVVVEGDKTRIPFRWPLLSIDFNRDRIIDDTELSKVKNGDTFYFWVNDDSDSNDINDKNNPGSGTNGADSKVNGASDLEDFFSVHLKIKDAFSFYDLASFNYRLKNVDGALNFVITDLTKQEAGKYLTDPQNNLPEADRLANKATKQITKDGVVLNQYADFIQQIKANGDKGIILVEGRAKTSNPLVLEIVEKSSKNVVFSSQLNLSIAGVEQMFRQKNLIEEMYRIDKEKIAAPPGVTSIAGHIMPGDDIDKDKKRGEPDRLVPASDHFIGFDRESDGSDFVHVHGYNVNVKDFRGEQTEVFKRLFWSGSKARFWGITWYGFDSQCAVNYPCYGQRAPNYHANVRHAFNAGKLLKNFVANNSFLKSGKATFSAHSLGNMVVSTAIQNNMPYGRYLMANPAVAEEAFVLKTDYDAGVKWDTATRKLMYNPDWRYPDGNDAGYQPFLWASEWYKLFTDERKYLTWRDYFSKVREDNNANPSKVFTFFATTDQAFRPYPLPLLQVDNDISAYPINKDQTSVLWTLLTNLWNSCWDSEILGTYSIALSELMKGTEMQSLLLNMDSIYGGWGFNLDQSDGYNKYLCGLDQNDPGKCEFVFIKPAEANLLDRNPVGTDLGRDILKEKPFFKKNGENSSLFTNSPVILTTPMRELLLANEIPALTFAVGHKGVEKFKELTNIDIRQEYLKNIPNASWPRGGDIQYDWRHSDIFNVAYPYLYRMYDEWDKKHKEAQ